MIMDNIICFYDHNLEIVEVDLNKCDPLTKSLALSIEANNKKISELEKEVRYKSNIIGGLQMKLFEAKHKPKKLFGIF